MTTEDELAPLPSVGVRLPAWEEKGNGVGTLRSVTEERGWRDAFVTSGSPRTPTHVRNNRTETRVGHAFVPSR